MHMRYIVLLLVMLYFAEANAVKAASSSKIDLGSDNSVGISKRLLRAHESADVGDTDDTSTTGDEERGPSGAWVSKLAELEKKTSSLAKIDMKISQSGWLMWGKDPEYVFNLWTFSSAWEKIDSSKKTIQWFRFTKAFREENGAGRFPDYEIYKLLKTKAPEDKMAIAFESLKQIPDVKILAETMQKYQFKRWIDQKETPTSIGQLLGIPHSTALTTERGPKDEILSAFTKMYNGGN